MPFLLKDLTALIETWAPPQLAEDWDNTGLQVGAPDWPADKIWVCLDADARIISQAGADKVNAIVAHHPLIFKPLQRIDGSMSGGKAVIAAIENKVAVYSAHTSLDAANGGLNDELARRIGMQCCAPILTPSESITPENAGKEIVGIGRLGKLARPCRLDALARHLMQQLSLPNLRLIADRDREVQQVALCSGSGGSLLPQVLNCSAEVYITGDVNYHQARDALSAGLAIIDIGHFGSERIVGDFLVRRLTDHFDANGIPAQARACLLETDPFQIMMAS